MVYQEIKVYLDKIIEPEYRDYFLILSPKGHEDVYIQLILNENNDLYCEVVSNENLPNNYKLNENKLNKLRELGFTMDSHDINHNCIFKAETEAFREEISKMVLEIFVNIFGLIVSDLEITFDG